MSITILSACRGPRDAHAGDSSASRQLVTKDTIDILEAVWRVADAGDSERRVALLYLPSADTGAMTASDAVRQALVRRGVPISARLPLGDDTVVVRVTRWTTESDGASVLKVLSASTTVLGTGRQRCRVHSGTVASYRSRRTSVGWLAK